MSQNKRVVLLGYIGHGKTSLYNLITQSNELTQEGGKSVTQRVLIGASKYLKGFEILDTPGFTAEETMESLSGVLAGLYYGDIDRILMVVKYERVKQMLSNVKQMFEKIKQLKDIITIVVTSWDLWNEQKSPNERQLIQVSIENATEISSIIFCSNPETTRNSDQKSIAICAEIEQILAQNNQRLTFKATEKVIENLATPNYINQDELDLLGGEINAAFYKIAKEYQIFIQEFDCKNEDTLDIMHYLQLDIKVTDEKIDEFIKKYGEKMNHDVDLYSENKQYLLFIKLKQSITMDYQNIIDLSYQKMKQANINYYTWIKKCPNCQRVWVKVAGCGKDTYCGNRVNEIDGDQQIQKENNFQKYEFITQNGKLICQKKVQPNQIWNAKTVLSQYVIQNKFVDTKNPDEAIQIISSKLNQKVQNLKLKVESYIEFCERNHSSGFLICEVIQNELINSRKDFQNLMFQELFNEIFQSVKAILEYLTLEQKFDYPLLQSKLQLLHKSVLQFNMDKFLQQITQKNQVKYLTLVRELFETQKAQEKQEGCNFKFIWDDQPPLSEQELKVLFSPDVFDYVTDRVKLETDEDDATKKELLKTLNLAIGEKLKTVQLYQTQQ